MNWSPVLPLATDPVVDPSGTSSDGSPIKNALAAAWGALFNVRYRMLLAYLAHSFRHHSIAATKGSPGRRGQLITRMFGEMYVLKSVAGLITQLPLDADLAVRAGPPFQMPYTLNYPERELDFWRLHLDLLGSARKILKDLEACTTDAAQDYARALLSADAKAKIEIEAILGELSTAGRSS